MRKVIEKMEKIDAIKKRSGEKLEQFTGKRKLSKMEKQLYDEIVQRVYRLLDTVIGDYSSAYLDYLPENHDIATRAYVNSLEKIMKIIGNLTGTKISAVEDYEGYEHEKH